ncbi:DUF1971 domain-containing protein [Novosphingobium sp. Gsoil 351]|uniref:DUF1971 domain-containing protein n=1 Tax=Novosphingobium sp. Gsoil 351 TaxID=2675225 RepID=UPI0012B4CEF3|nr:DUF1971 domain-containing protein [Novosphingobium sp. Gsoil 351]QGN55048.1 DUF1971 domain-containing protein [Novosphingobium sp. Gsoil 351]
MTKLPPGLQSYKRTQTFTAATIPRALLNDHSTKDGTWGLIHVEKGELLYVVTDPRRPASEQVLTPESALGVVEPTILHRVEPISPVRFHLEFFRGEPTVGPR